MPRGQNFGAHRTTDKCRASSSRGPAGPAHRECGELEVDIRGVLAVPQEPPLQADPLTLASRLRIRTRARSPTSTASQGEVFPGISLPESPGQARRVVRGPSALPEERTDLGRSTGGRAGMEPPNRLRSVSIFRLSEALVLALGQLLVVGTEETHPRAKGPPHPQTHGEAATGGSAGPDREAGERKSGDRSMVFSCSWYSSESRVAGILKVQVYSVTVPADASPPPPRACAQDPRNHHSPPSSQHADLHMLIRTMCPSCRVPQLTEKNFFHMHNCLWFQTSDLPVEGMRKDQRERKNRRRKRRPGQGKWSA